MDNRFKGKMSSNIKEFLTISDALCAEGVFIVQRQEKTVFFDWVLG